MKLKILCMYSGGLDSAGALWRILTDECYNNYDIHVHHIHNINHENRAHIEDIVVKNTLPLFSQYSGRKFTFSQNWIDFSCLPYPSNIPFDTDIFAFVSGSIVSIDTSFEYVAIGRTKDDVVNGGEHTANQIKRAKETFDLVKRSINKESNAKYILPVENLTKKEIWDLLPKDIREMTWSCRRPVYKKVQDEMQILPCQKCASCVSRNSIIG